MSAGDTSYSNGLCRNGSAIVTHDQQAVLVSSLRTEELLLSSIASADRGLGQVRGT